jgi:hypothetical protein
MTTAVLTVAKNGGTPASGGITCAASDTIQLGATSTVGWPMVPAPRYRIRKFPPSFALPAGWSSDANGYYYDFSGTPPPSFSAGTTFGKWNFTLTVYGLPTDEYTWLSLHGLNGEREVGSGETNQFGADWTVDLNATIHGLSVEPIADFYQIVAGGATPQSLASGDIGLTGTGELKIKYDTVHLLALAGDDVATLDTSYSVESALIVNAVSRIVLQVDGVDRIAADTAGAIDITSADAINLTAGSATKNIKLTGRFVQAGGTLTDGNETINVGTAVDWVFDGALTGDRTKTLGLTGVYDTAELVAYVINSAAHTMAFVNGGTSGGTLITVANSTKMTLRFVYDSMSGDWFLATARKT